MRLISTQMNLFIFTTNHDAGEIVVLIQRDESIFVLFYNFRSQSWRKFKLHRNDDFLFEGLPYITRIHSIVDNVFFFFYKF